MHQSISHLNVLPAIIIYRFELPQLMGSDDPNVLQHRETGLDDKGNCSRQNVHLWVQNSQKQYPALFFGFNLFAIVLIVFYSKIFLRKKS